MKEYLLTICIPTYNRAALLHGLIENIFSEIDQSDYSEDVQILIVDGNSEDNTPQIIEEFKIGGRRIKYFRRENKVGIDRDILKCIELSDGEYCWLFSDDDRLTSGAIKHLVDILREEGNLTGCFCNRQSYDFQMKKKVAEAKGWPGRILKEDHIFIDKAECFKWIGMDFGFLSSQVVKRSEWQSVVEGEIFGELYNSYYLMVHIIFRMMDKKFKWLYINKPLVKQRTGNDSLLNREGIMKRQLVEHNSFQIILDKHYDKESEVRKEIFRKMVARVPRALANLKSQHMGYSLQFRLIKLYYDKYKNYPAFWFKVIPVFLVPNIIFNIVKKVYFKYLVHS